MTNTDAPALSIEYWPIERLVPYARNARTHSPAQVAELAGSIRSFGFVNPVLVGSDGDIIAGHGRLPFNTDGGGLCNNHPGNKGGMTKILEAVRQCRGEAHPAVQVQRREFVLAHGTGGNLASAHAAGTLILQAE